MRANRLVVGSSLLFVVVACSSATPSTTSDVVLPPSGAADPVAPSTPGATNANALVYFDGAVDTVRGVMNLVVRDAAGTIKSESTLPYGDNSGQVYMHTCSAAYNSGSHQLTGNVQAVNLMPGTVTAMNAVVDSISVTGVTLASGSGAGGTSGVIASYGSVAVNTPNCASTQPWAFQNLAGDPSFTFKGHADGTAPVSGVTFTGSFSQGSASSAQAIADFETFRTALTGTYTSITVSGSQNATGRTCTGAVATALCKALHDGTDSGSVACNGTTWHVNFDCCSGPQVIANEQGGGGCACSDEDVVRVDSGCHWGGLDETAQSCNQVTQTMSVHCQ